MANSERVYNSNDAAGIKPKLLPDEELLARDNSGGIDFDARTAQFGDGGQVTGPKASLSADGKGAPQTDEIAERKQGEKGNR